MNAGELFRQGRAEEIWSYYCGWLDLSLQDFMEIHDRLLMEQIDLLSRCDLGRALMRGHVPSSPDDFRRVVPLSTYRDYIPFLTDRREDALPTKPCAWVRTTGSTQEYGCPFKWAPVSEERRTASIRSGFSTFIFAGCTHKGHFSFRPGDRFLYCAAPRPYVSGEALFSLQDEFPFRFLPSVEEAERVSFEERIRTGFQLAMSEGLDLFAGLSSVLVAVGERFSGLSPDGGERLGSLNLPTAFRLLRAYVRSRLRKRPMLPRDIWSVKAIVSSGADAAIYKERVKELWGRYPLSLYSSTEAGLVATQLWNNKGMSFVPGTNYMEFIPEDEHLRSRSDPTYEPRTVLLNEVKAGERYEIVFTGLRGACFVRYRIGDMISIVSLRDEELGVDIPQMEFIGRCDSIIDLAGFARLSEAVVWEAIERTGIPYSDWIAHKEISGNQPALRICLEPASEDHPDAEEAAAALHKTLMECDEDYHNLDAMLGLKPVRITWLAPGTFRQYRREKSEAGADLGQLKPSHMQPSEEVLAMILRIHGSRC